jgi:cyclin L
LRILGFNLDVVLPYTLCITYLQTLDVFTLEAKETSSTLAKRAIQHLNSSLQNPQLLYLTHQPPEIACAAIYLAAREVGVKLPEGQWWEVFDCGREKLGFLVVAMRSMEGFVRAEKEKWTGRTMPLRLRQS